VKKIGFITKNNVLAQSLAYFIKSNPDLPFEPYMLQNPDQAAVEADILKIDVAVVEVSAGTANEADKALALCSQFRTAAPECRILLLVPQGSREVRDMAIKAVNSKIIDDYVFLDTSLDYFLAKLLAM